RDSDDRSDEPPPAQYEAKYLAQVETLNDLVRVEDLDWRKMQHLTIRDCPSILRSPSRQSWRTVRETGRRWCAKRGSLLATRTGCTPSGDQCPERRPFSGPAPARLCCDTTSDSIPARSFASNRTDSDSTPGVNRDMQRLGVDAILVCTNSTL